MATKTIAGKTVEVNEEGFLVNPSDWSEEMAPVLAEQVGIFELTEQHWKVIRFMRKDFAEKGQIPTVRRIKNEGGVPTKDLYALFPEGPAKKAAFISGLGKPQGCV
ncbi:MAG: TusE/DsrC/DsvC family sulfur relay protein [Calditrichaeota bacterium]|nr:TusE/DsrC/DsvC family sulfur relay protein [Calditrichota bacterium]MCB0295622.1 TusE/DsrC/DsvC family sulfur relay protein [Calditrichota bacterium]MCB0302221.1 TusE/DsrC/DsvC family sulfur relay protein [Calditrichota bacterium]